MRLVIVSNRLPVIIERDPSGLRTKPSSGGLVSALSPVLQRRGGLWIGWAGVVDLKARELEARLDEHGKQVGFDLRPVPLSRADVEGFYQGFSNEIIWPLFHDLQSRCNFEPEYWVRYVAVRYAFANTVLACVEPDDFVWVHDYHLMGMGMHLRERGLRNKLGFFLHIPFPPPDVFNKLPWRSDVLEGLLHHDIIGFQTPRDVENFIDCVRVMIPAARFHKRGSTVVCSSAIRDCAIGSFPVGIDYRHFSKEVESDVVTARAEALLAEMPNRQVILSVDRLDYTKGIPDRLRGFQLALRRFPELHRKVTLLQVVLPSREAVQQYQDLKAEIERLVTQVNGEFTQPGWVPIHHVFRNLEWEELLAYYRAADVGLVTPLKDGMNLVAKEYCACQTEGNGVLILSEFAGSAVQLKKDAILVNPYDREGVAAAILSAVRLTCEERRPAMRRLRSVVRRQDVFWWADKALDACGVSKNDRATAHEKEVTTFEDSGVFA